MADPPLVRVRARNGPVSTALWILLAAALLYWAACAVLLPVTTWDSQVYNLGRLLIAEKAGFWSNPHWFSERQVIFPWAFDAVHYPFVKLGFGEAIPSFLCFIGLLIVVYKILRDRYSSQLALFSLPGPGQYANHGLPGESATPNPEKTARLKQVVTCGVRDKSNIERLAYEFRV